MYSEVSDAIQRELAALSSHTDDSSSSSLSNHGGEPLHATNANNVNRSGDVHEMSGTVPPPAVTSTAEHSRRASAADILGEPIATSVGAATATVVPAAGGSGDGLDEYSFGADDDDTPADARSVSVTDALERQHNQPRYDQPMVATPLASHQMSSGGDGVVSSRGASTVPTTASATLTTPSTNTKGSLLSTNTSSSTPHRSRASEVAIAQAEAAAVGATAFSSSTLNPGVTHSTPRPFGTPQRRSESKETKHRTPASSRPLPSTLTPTAHRRFREDAPSSVKKPAEGDDGFSNLSPMGKRVKKRMPAAPDVPATSALTGLSQYSSSILDSVMLPDEEDERGAVDIEDVRRRHRERQQRHVAHSTTVSGVYLDEMPSPIRGTQKSTARATTPSSRQLSTTFDDSSLLAAAGLMGAAGGTAPLNTADRQLWREAQEEVVSLRKALLQASNSVHSSKQELKLEKERHEQTLRERDRAVKGLRDLTHIIEQKEAEVGTELKQRVRTETDLRERLATITSHNESLEDHNTTLTRELRETKQAMATLLEKNATLERHVAGHKEEVVVARALVAKLKKQQGEVDEFHNRHLKRFVEEASLFQSHWQRLRAVDEEQAKNVLEGALAAADRSVMKAKKKLSTKKKTSSSFTPSDDDSDGSGNELYSSASSIESGDEGDDRVGGASTVSDSSDEGELVVVRRKKHNSRRTDKHRHRDDDLSRHRHHSAHHDDPYNSSHRRSAEDTQHGHTKHAVDLQMLLAKHEAVVASEAAAANKHRRKMAKSSSSRY